MSRARSTTTTRIAWGAFTGLGAYVLGYLLTYAWRAPDVNDSLEGINVLAELLGGAAIPTWKAVAWLFYGEHFVATVFPTFGGDTMVNLVSRGDGLEVLYIIPPVLLVIAGAIAARFDRTDESGDGAISGAAIVVGYLPLVVIGAVATAHAIGESSGSIAPDPVTAILLAGVVYPLAFGGLGGFIASLR